MLAPTRSMSWPQARRVMLAVGLGSLAIGGFFLALGFPFVLPFSGLEVVLFVTAFYLVLRDGERREIVCLEGDRLVIETGARRPKARFEFNRPWVRVTLQPASHRHHPSRLLVGYGARELELGRFLTESERRRFARTLINALAKNR